MALGTLLTVELLRVVRNAVGEAGTKEKAGGDGIEEDTGRITSLVF